MTYANPIIPGFHPDPSICRVGEDYYLVTSSFEFFPGVPIFHSRDLVNWRQLGHVLDRPSQLPLEGAKASDGIYAPTLRHGLGRFWMITTNCAARTHILVHSERPEGPWSEPIKLEMGCIDPSLTFDADGRVYMQANAPGGILQREIDPFSGAWKSEPRVLWSGAGWAHLEAPHLYHIGDWYYLLCAEGGTEYGHCVTVARARGPWGPFEGFPQNPILTHRGRHHPIQATGHADLFQDHAGHWWVVCLAIRPQGYPFGHVLGRETFLAPVTWADGWPVIHGGRPIELQMDAPTLPLQPWPVAPSRDVFAGAARLEPHWNFLRNPLPGSWALTPAGLRLTATRATLDDCDAPAWVGRRQQHHACRFHARIEVAGPGEAGLTVFHNERHHDDLAVTRSGGQRVLRLRRRTGSLAAVVAERPVPDGPLTLGIHATAAAYELGLVRDDGGLDALGACESHYRSTEVAGGFTGVFLALYAQHGAVLDAAWAEYRETPNLNPKGSP
jgi:alpha-N-arabinofuranosidase